MNITIYAVGKIKERFYREAIAEFEKRLRRYCVLKIIEVPDEKTPQDASDAINQQILEKEGRRLLSFFSEREYLIALDIKGRTYSSESFAGHIDSLGVMGRSSVGFVIGGSLGLSQEVLKRADERVSFSEMTFPHQMMRLILLEQIYRAFRINCGEPYHK